ncbi:MAG: hypothetical protein ABGZ17_29970 [Planctomycetaceae bacterium]
MGVGGIYLIECFQRGLTGTMPGMEFLTAVLKIWQAMTAGDAATRAVVDRLWRLLDTAIDQNNGSLMRSDSRRAIHESQTD